MKDKNLQMYYRSDFKRKVCYVVWNNCKYNVLMCFKRQAIQTNKRCIPQYAAAVAAFIILLSTFSQKFQESTSSFHFTSHFPSTFHIFHPHRILKSLI